MRYIFEGKHGEKGNDDDLDEEIVDINESIMEECLTWDEVNPKVFGYDDDIYRCFSITGSGWNPNTGLFHLQAKTWIWDLTIRVLSDNFYIGWAWANGKFININQTFKFYDLITIHMCKIIEFGEKGKTTNKDTEIMAYYLVPFIYENSIKEHAKNEDELTDLKNNYLKSKVKKDNKRMLFQNGYPKFVKDDTLNMLFDNAKDLKNMNLIHERSLYGQDLEQLIWIYNSDTSNYFDGVTK